MKLHPIQQKLLELSGKQNLTNLSYREIGKLVGCPDQPQKIKHHLLQLEKRGLLSAGRSRLSVKGQTGNPVARNRLVSVPIYGTADCGPATVYAEQNLEGYLRISGKLLTRKKEIYAIRASGYSMNRANISGECVEDGDYVVVDPTYRLLKNGDYVLAVVDGNATIKRYFNDRENQRIILLAESSASYSPIFIHYSEAANFLVNGKIIQVIKKPKTAWGNLKKIINREA